MPYQALRTELDRLAHQVWDDVTLVRAAQGAFRLGEVTVTERLHLSLLQSGLLTGMVRYSVPDETRTGADWEWLVQSAPMSNLFYRYRIQAKILKAIPAGNPHALQFSGINHKPPKSKANPNPRTQRETLLTQSAVDNAFPLYAFYIGDPWPATTSIRTPQWATKAGVPREQFGCTVVDAEAVDVIFNQSTINKQQPPNDANQYLDPPNSLLGRPAGGWRLSDLFPSGSRSNGPKSNPGGSPAPQPGTGGDTGSGGPGEGSGGRPSLSASASTGPMLLAEPVDLTAHEYAMLQELTEKRGRGLTGTVITHEPLAKDPTLAGMVIFEA